MKNVIVFTVADKAFAVELRWIREVFTFAHVTPVPGAPRQIAGVVNFRGSIIPILNVVTRSHGPDEPASAGESGVLVEVERCQAALRAGTIDEVSSLADAEREGYLIDSRHREVELLWPPNLFDGAQSIDARRSGLSGESR